MTFQWNTNTAAGSLWRQSFVLTDGNGAPLDLTGLTWEFVIRTSTIDTTAPPLVAVTTAPGPQGQITVDLPTATVTVTLVPGATAALGKGAWPHALWSDPADADSRSCWVQGVFYTVLVPAP